MAWQQPGVGGGGPVGGESNGPPATEYTLQGVMRFLQLEWHSHERARNAWDIERAEMKAKIARQEGELRGNKKLNDQLERQIRMLEMALKIERANKAKKSEEQNGGDEAKEQTANSKAQKPLNKPHNSFLDVDPESKDSAEKARETQRDQSRTYLQKCVEEITYLLTPPVSAPVPPSMNNSSSYPSDQLHTMDEPYSHRPKGQHPLMPNQMHVSPAPNHQPPPVPSLADMPLLQHSQNQQQQATPMSREVSQHALGHSYPQSMNLPNHSVQELRSSLDAPNEEIVEKITHQYDNYGQPINTPEQEASGTRQIIADEAENWNFEAGDNQAPTETDIQAPLRPDRDAFPSVSTIPSKSPPRPPPTSHRRKASGSAAMSRRRSEGHETRDSGSHGGRAELSNFKAKFAMRGHLDVVRSVIFTGGGSPSEPEICTAGDDGMIKRWIIPASYGGHQAGNDLDISSYFTHRGHEGVVTSLAACPAAANFATGGRVAGDGWIFSGGEDATVKVWERGRVDPKATLEGHTDAVWTVCVLPTTCAAVFGTEAGAYGGPDRILVASGSADGTVKIWAVSAPPTVMSPSTGSRRGVGGTRRHSVTSGSNFPSSPQPSVATTTPFHYMLVHSIERGSSPTCISPLSATGNSFVVSYADASVLCFDTRTGEEIIGMASTETYNGTPETGINTVVATTVSIEGSMADSGRMIPEDESVIHGATGSSGDGSVEGIIISGHEDQFIRFYDANSGQCTYSMRAHPSAISSLSLSKDGREAVSGGHDASIRFWSLEKRFCTQELTSHRIMRGEGVCSVVWSQDGRLVVSAGGDGVVKVFAR